MSYMGKPDPIAPVAKSEGARARSRVARARLARPARASERFRCTRARRERGPVRFGESRRRRRRRRRACDDVRACFGWRSIYAIVLREVGGVATTTRTTRTTRTMPMGRCDADGCACPSVWRARGCGWCGRRRDARSRGTCVCVGMFSRVSCRACVRTTTTHDARRRRTRRGELRAGNVRRESCTAESMVVRRWCVWVGDLHSVV